MADSPTVYARYGDNTLYAVDAESGTQEWKFRRPVFPITAPTVVADPEGGDRVWSRVLLGTLGHHHRRQPGTESSAVNGTSTGESAGASRNDSGADLSDAELTYADLSGTDFRSIRLDETIAVGRDSNECFLTKQLVEQRGAIIDAESNSSDQDKE